MQDHKKRSSNRRTFYIRTVRHYAHENVDTMFSVHSILQAFACSKLGNVAGWDINLDTGRRIAALGSFATAYGEVTKTDQTDIAALLQFRLYSLKYRINSRGCIGLGETSFFGNCRYELILIHVSIPFFVV